MKKRYLLPALLLLLCLVYLLGPRAEKGSFDTDLPTLPTGLSELDAHVAQGESLFPLKEGNEARIVWAEPSGKRKTPVAVVYLHGFSASHREGFPAHMDFARRYGCNLYLARLSDHGIESDEPMKELSVDRLWESAIEAYAIGRQLGDEVIIMSTSSGSTLALKLSACFPEIKALINFAPADSISLTESLPSVITITSLDLTIFRRFLISVLMSNFSRVKKT